MGLADARHRASQAAATVARALDWPDELVSQLRELGKGYSAARSQAPRDLLKDEVIEVLIDRLSAIGLVAVAVAWSRSDCARAVRKDRG